MEVGLKAGAPGCDTNLLIIVTDDPAMLLPAIVETHRSAFDFTVGINIDTGGCVSLAGFVGDGPPLRRRQVIETVSADGMPLNGDPLPDAFGSTQGYGGVRRRVTVQWLAQILVGFARTSAATSAASLPSLKRPRPLASASGLSRDYPVFVTLADVSSGADLISFPSILNLFNPHAERQRRMTDWDLAFLDGLYPARLNASSGKALYREIADRMVKGKAGGE